MVVASSDDHRRSPSRAEHRVRVNTTDHVQMANVCITALNDEHSEGQTLEQYEEVRVNDVWQELDTAASMEGKLMVEAFDLAGNCTKHEAYSVQNTLRACKPLPQWKFPGKIYFKKKDNSITYIGGYPYQLLLCVILKNSYNYV